MLYTAIAEFAGLSDNKSTVLDVCCGTGTIGMVLSKASRTVLWSQWSSARYGLVPKNILYILSSFRVITHSFIYDVQIGDGFQKALTRRDGAKYG